MKLTCIVLPDPEATRRIRDLMDECTAATGSRRAHLFPPHFSLRIDFEIPESKLQAFVGELERAITQSKPLRLDLTRFGFYDWRVAFLQVHKTPELQVLHETVLGTVQKYRTPWVLPELRENPHLTPAQRANVEKYGYHLAGAEYDPHITVAGSDMTAEAFADLKRELSSRHLDIHAHITQVALIDRDTPGNPVFKVFELHSAQNKDSQKGSLSKG